MRVINIIAACCSVSTHCMSAEPDAGLNRTLQLRKRRHAFTMLKKWQSKDLSQLHWTPEPVSLSTAS